MKRSIKAVIASFAIVLATGAAGWGGEQGGGAETEGLAGGKADGVEPSIELCGGVLNIQCPAGKFCLTQFDSIPGPNADGVCVPGLGIGVGVPCGSRGLAECGAGLYCNHLPSDEMFTGPSLARPSCGRDDVPGTCAPIPAECVASVSPTCGCDGMTYTNSCVAAAAGVPVDHRGACQ
jgi:hypothetical protein